MRVTRVCTSSRALRPAHALMLLLLLMPDGPALCVMAMEMVLPLRAMACFYTCMHTYMSIHYQVYV